jgi:hypothetical protein
LNALNQELAKFNWCFVLKKVCWLNFNLKLKYGIKFNVMKNWKMISVKL